jgi:hypothetical protein
VVYTQFLTAAQPVPAPVPASRLLVNSGAPLAAPNYNSAAAGQDSPPSLLLGVTVVTSWSWASQVRTDRTYTEIADNGATNTLISSQAHATALSVTTSDANGNQLIGLVGDIELNGSLANTSSASAEAVAASISQSNGASVTGANSTVVSPPNPAGSSATTGAGQPPYLGSYSPCGWGLVGPSQVSDVSTSTAGGLPIAPSDVGTGSTPASMVETDLKANGGGSCAGFRFSNSVLGAETTDPRLQLQAGYPMIQVVDSSGSSTEVAAKGAISSSSAAGNVGSVYAKTEVDFATAVQVFPGLPFVTTASTCGSGTQPCGQGLVNVFLTKATLGCQANGSPVATASYSGYLTYWTQTGWHSLSLSWSSTSGSTTDPLASVDLSQTVTTYNGSPVPLSAYINAWSTGRSITQSSSGESTIPSVVAITTANTRYGDASSSIGLQLGKLSCLAVDNR